MTQYWSATNIFSNQEMIQTKKKGNQEMTSHCRKYSFMLIDVARISCGCQNNSNLNQWKHQFTQDFVKFT